MIMNYEDLSPTIRFFWEVRTFGERRQPEKWLQARSVIINNFICPWWNSNEKDEKYSIRIFKPLHKDLGNDEGIANEDTMIRCEEKDKSWQGLEPNLFHYFLALKQKKICVTCHNCQIFWKNNLCICICIWMGLGVDWTQSMLFNNQHFHK